ncbi:MAG: hypothetical protein KAV42_10365 [Candidatus Krumholzibacteria bacterium]|nr:hypothetical protein [Candidatus Krumholzibacteria bacterium]
MAGIEKGLFSAEVAGNEKLSPACRLIRFARPEGFPDAKPGHFVSVRVNSFSVPLLRRPYSIMDLTETELLLLVKVVGPGSRLLAEAAVGDRMDIAGVLGGTVFPSPAGEDAVFVGGGTGLAPMIFAARTWKREGNTGNSYLIHGAATSEELLGTFCESDFTKVFRSTMDGSEGYDGDAVSYLQSLLNDDTISGSKLYSCGPAGMVKALELKVSTRFDSHYTSLEAVMACGVGACRGCTVPLREEDGRKLRAVCSDGTVFDASQIAWEDWE